MKKTIQFLAVSLAVLLCSFIAAKKTSTDDDPKYYVATGWEVPTSSANKGQPVVSNVTYVNCKYHSPDKVKLQLAEFYNAYYRKTRNALHLNPTVAWRFDTRDKAEKKRRELIVDFQNNGGWEPLLVEKFTVLCND